MMNIYTVSFFGHRNIECGTEIDNRLDKLLHDIITQKEYVDFLIGRDGEFDLLASAAIKRAVSSYGSCPPPAHELGGWNRVYSSWNRPASSHNAHHACHIFPISRTNQ